jgi:BirA family biotin operon repressor/biotin-[acetyl-CoA-carboxylase] ligase
VVRLAATASTNDVAAALAAAGWPEGTVVVTGHQRGGRGRQGRPWHSPPGSGLCLSVVLRPARPLREWAELSWVIAAAVAVVARAEGAGDVGLKFPNDVVAAGRKLSGVLLETRTGAGGAAALVAGIGLNVNAAAEDFPAELRAGATSLRIATGRAHALAPLLARLCGELEAWYAAWRAGGAPAALGRLADAGLAVGAAGGGGRGALETGPAGLHEGRG